MSAPQNVHVNPLYLGTYLAARAPMATAAEQLAASEPFQKKTDQPLSPPRMEGSIQIADAAPPVEGEADPQMAVRQRLAMILAGGALHADTIVAACRYAASELAEPKLQQFHKDIFMERLAASVSLDRRITSVSSLGYNGDNSDATRFIKPFPTATVYGVQY